MTNAAHGKQGLMLALAMFLLGGSLPATAAAPVDTAPSAPGTGLNFSPLPALDRRITLLAKELDLSETQQVAMRKLLLEQREKVARLWNESAIPSQDRIRATQMIGDQTADRIRQLLTEEQRKKYIQPRTTRPAPPPGQNRSVEEWMQATRAALPPATDSNAVP
jgi:hypothetical protein